MTRNQQTQFIIAKIVEKLQDMPDVQGVIGTLFTAWFQALVDQGLAEQQPVIQKPIEQSAQVEQQPKSEEKIPNAGP